MAASSALTLARDRLRARMWPILQTAAAAVAAWYVAILLLPDDRPLFASIAAVIGLGAAHGQRGQRAAELIGGVVLGIAVADVIVHVIGTGPWQIGVMIVLAMSAAVALGGGPLLVSEAAVSAILLATLEPVSGPGLSPDRFFEALIGGAVVFAVSSLLFPPDPALHVGRAAQQVFADLGRTLEEIARALAEGDARRAQAALQAARAIDDRIDAVEEQLAVGRETARFAPPRRRARAQLDRYARSLTQIDFAVRDTRVLARTVLRRVRAGGPAPDGLPDAIRDLGQAVWALAASYDHPARGAEARELALGAAARVTATAEERQALALTEIAVQVRSTAVDLARASELADADEGGAADEPTEELLAATR